MSSSSPEAKPLASLSEPTSVDRSDGRSSEARGFELSEAKYDADVGDMRPAEDTDVAVVLVSGFGEVGLPRGAEDEEDDKLRRAISMLKLDSRDNGGKGDELLRLRDRKFADEKGSLGSGFPP